MVYVYGGGHNTALFGFIPIKSVCEFVSWTTGRWFRRRRTPESPALRRSGTPTLLPKLVQQARRKEEFWLAELARPEGDTLIAEQGVEAARVEYETRMVEESKRQEETRKKKESAISEETNVSK